MLKESVKDGRSSNTLLANCLKLRFTQRQALIAHVHEFVYVHVCVLHTYKQYTYSVHVHVCISHVVYMYMHVCASVCVVFD